MVTIFKPIIKKFKQHVKISTQDHPFENLNQLFEFLNARWYLKT